MRSAAIWNPKYFYFILLFLHLQARLLSQYICPTSIAIKKMVSETLVGASKKVLTSGPESIRKIKATRRDETCQSIPIALRNYKQHIGETGWKLKRDEDRSMKKWWTNIVRQDIAPQQLQYSTRVSTLSLSLWDDKPREDEEIYNWGNCQIQTEYRNQNGNQYDHYGPIYGTLSFLSLSRRRGSIFMIEKAWFRMGPEKMGGSGVMWQEWIKISKGMSDIITVTTAREDIVHIVRKGMNVIKQNFEKSECGKDGK